jgi:hypothetical protein
MTRLGVEDGIKRKCEVSKGSLMDFMRSVVIWEMCVVSRKVN